MRFGRAWNEIVVTLRDGDLLSNAESQDLQFGRLCDGAFFGVDELPLLPCFLTSPAFVANASFWRGASRARYGCFAPALQQARDLTAWLFVQLRISRFEKRGELLEVMERRPSQSSTRRRARMAPASSGSAARTPRCRAAARVHRPRAPRSTRMASCG